MPDQISATVQLQGGIIRVFGDQFEQDSRRDGLETVFWPLLIVREIGKDIDSLHVYASLPQGLDCFI